MLRFAQSDRSGAPAGIVTLLLSTLPKQSVQRFEANRSAGASRERLHHAVHTTGIIVEVTGTACYAATPWSGFFVSAQPGRP